MKEINILNMPVPENGYCIIKTVVQTLDYSSCTYRNNAIEMPIPWQAAIEIYKAWTSHHQICSQENIVGRYFGQNQEGFAHLLIPKQFVPGGNEDTRIAGISYCTLKDQQKDTFDWIEPDELPEDDEEE